MKTGFSKGIQENKQKIVRKRLEKISSFNPNFVAVGTAGFRGYVIFGFENKDFYVLESIYSGNATYILGKDWEQISKLSKAEILKNNLHKKRLIHYKGWESEVEDILK